MNFKEVFLNLTEYTTPFGFESDLEKFLPSSLSKDNWGNYFISIGSSETLFTCHLDNYCKEKVKINHVIEGDIIKTDGKSILGADNKAGVVTLLYLISQKIPGTYYFFLGEEPIISGGCWGSTKLVENNPDFLRKFKRAIAFDRKMTGSIISRQMAQECCSQEFVNSLISEFSNSGINMKDDKTGYYTDTGNFIELIPECTNISIGVWNEHHTNEYVDISYVEKMAFAASKIKWEELITVREPKWWIDENQSKKNFIKKYTNFRNRKEDGKLFNLVYELLEDKNYYLMNRTGFEPNKVMFFNHWFEEKPIEIIIFNGNLSINGQNFGKISKKQLERVIKKI